MLGLKRHIIQLSPHQEEWLQLYQEEQTKVQVLLNNLILDIQHIGSTAIKGIHAKPILDMGILVESRDDLGVFAEKLATIGYAYRGDAGNAGGHVFVINRAGDIRTHHIHLIVQGDPQWENYLFFRDYLNRHPPQAQAYSELKQDLALKFANDRGAYTQAKTAFVKEILSKRRS